MKQRLVSLILIALFARLPAASAETKSLESLKDLVKASPDAAPVVEAMNVQFSALAAVRKGNTDLFLEKHPEDAARFQGMKFVHLPVQRGWCSMCHADVQDPSVLREDGNDLCLACHKPKNESLQKSHMGVTIFTDKCTVCHSPHASSEAKMIRSEGQHPAFSSCDSCHSGMATGGRPALKDSIAGACMGCHPQLEDASKDKVVHGAISMGACTNCHNPHFSPRKAFQRALPQEFCRGCHDIPDRGHPFGKHRSFKLASEAKGRAPGGSSVPASFDCVSCHRPHSGALPKLLRAPKKELCLDCHKM